jgi:hypothetical protein
MVKYKAKVKHDVESGRTSAKSRPGLEYVRSELKVTWHQGIPPALQWEADLCMREKVKQMHMGLQAQRSTHDRVAKVMPRNSLHWLQFLLCQVAMPWDMI